MKKIGRYIIRGLLGRGGMGKVYKVELPPIGRIAALKILEPDPLLAKLLGPAKLQDLFTSEARIMAGLQHPNIVAIQDFDTAGGKPFYVMDFFANNLGTMIGETYRTEQASRKITIDKALDYCHQTLEGLAGLHDAGIIHRDIKPFNLLVTAWDTVKICDFGLSKLRGEAFPGPSNLNVGSPYYAAPEQEKDPDSAEASADLYAVGIILYRMLTGQLPLTAPFEKNYQPPSRLNQDLSDVWDDFIAKAIAADPGRRFVDTRSMLQALDDLGRHWQQHKEKTCAIDAPAAQTALFSTGEQPFLRTKPVKVYPREAIRIFKLDDLWQPSAYIRNRFEIKQNQTIHDHTTGLTWQQAGSTLPASWKNARGYINRLNQDKAGGINTWRLPTIEELSSLLSPAPQAQDLCIAPIFDPTQRRLWSADRRSFSAAYYVDIELGFVGWHDFSAPYYVRAVSS